MAAKGNLARTFGSCRAAAGFEPFAIRIDETDHGDGSFEKYLGQPGDSIETLFGRGIQNVKRPERGDALGFVWRYGGLYHTGDKENFTFEQSGLANRAHCLNEPCPVAIL
jgi:hypothetical protein